MADPGFSNGGKVERRRREDRGAEGAEGIGCGKGVSNLFDFTYQNVDF